jgi:cytochrome b
MGYFTSPTSFRLNAVAAGHNASSVATTAFHTFNFISARGNTHESHPPIGNLILLVFEAVLEVVCVSLPGYIVARQGMFDAENQKFVANLNVALFTPCLSMLVPRIVVDLS